MHILLCGNACGELCNTGSLGKTAQYTWFFLAYTLLNAVFFTANNIAYASLVTFVQKIAKNG